MARKIDNDDEDDEDHDDDHHRAMPLQLQTVRLFGYCCWWKKL